MKNSQVLPTDEDVKWVLRSCGERNHGGSNDWFQENVKNGKITFNDLTKLLITIWEAGRIKATNYEN